MTIVNRRLFSYIGMMLITFMLISIFPSQIGLWIAAVIFAVSAYGQPIGLLSLISVLCMFVFGYMSNDFFGGILGILPVIAAGIAVGLSIRSKKTLSAAMVFGSVAYLLPFLCETYYLSVINKTTITELLTEPIRLAGQTLGEELGEELSASALQGAAGQELSGLLSKGTENVATLVEGLLPALFIISAAEVALIAVYGARAVLRRTVGSEAVESLRPFAEIRLYPSISILTILFAVLLFFTEGTVRVLIANALLLFSAMFYVAGLALAAKLLRRVIGMRPVRVIILALAGMFIGIVYPVLGLVGSFFGNHDEDDKQDNKETIEREE